ncbi:MAG: hypothetical protein J1F01_05720 [Oscillospiraceae bacterium]|nr:hypothetical protein [Oscillospiraceae bacterium]
MAGEEPVTEGRFKEFERRMEDEHKRQNRRLELLEQNTEDMQKLLLTVERLAANMENMLKEQARQGERLEALEGRDGEMWRKAVGYVLSAIISGAIGAIIAYAKITT